MGHWRYWFNEQLAIMVLAGNKGLLVNLDITRGHKDAVIGHAHFKKSKLRLWALNIHNFMLNTPVKSDFEFGAPLIR